MQADIEKIRGIIERILGQPRSVVYSNGWQSYDCPKCAEENGGPDGKGNLEVSLNPTKNGFYCHCWKCGYSSKIHQLIKHYGSYTDKSEYKQIISDIKSSSLYTLDKDVEEIVKESIEVKLPKGFVPFVTKDRIINSDGLDYLHKRGLSNNLIMKYNLGYVDSTGEYKYQRRIILPSYDEYGNLNYWLGRDWTNKNKVKYMNANVEKTSIVFNEKLINYYEPIILCEGTFDAMVLPNSIPLLGKSLNADHAVYNMLIEKSKSNIIICLDADAKYDAYKLYNFLNQGVLKNRIKYIEMGTKDASLVFQEEGKKGIIKLMKTAKNISEFDLIAC